ncbi:MAG: hypothetical protein K0S33_2584 [Bacteroidetes bacterium]|jgi:TolA-binding protein|nr:hypothetical protein [Bacteroidota bacterium]
MKTIIVIAAVFLLASACGQQAVEEKASVADTVKKDTVALKPDNSKEGLLKQIKNLEDTLYASEKLDKKLGNRAISLYQEFHKYYWQDTLSIDFMFKAAEIADNMGYPQKAIELYQSCYDHYPQSSLAPYCLFRIGNIYQFTLNDYVEAKIAYNDCKKEYPNSPVTKDAINLLNNVAKSDKQLIEEFEKKNKIKKD